jgi:hypothetical protein
VKAGLLVLATALGAVGSRYLSSETHARSGIKMPDRACVSVGTVLSLELTALVAAAATGAVLVAFPSAPPAGVPLATSLGTLVPQRPGINYLHDNGVWKRLELPPGRSTVKVAAGSLQVDTGHRRGLQPDGPECATALLMRPTLARCPDEVLEPDDAAALTALRKWLRHRGLSRLAVQADASPRSGRAVELLGGAAAHPQALVLTGTWDSASAALQRLGRTVPEGGVYLAPWLFEGTLLARYATAAPLVVLPFDPKGRDALRYAAALPAGEAPTAAGYRAWGGRTDAPQVWATTPASIFPSGLGHDHLVARGWFPGGALVPVS